MDYLSITAEALGLSRSTVCRAIKSSQYVSLDTQKRILDYIREHFPEKLENRRLQEQLKKKSKKNITVIMPCKPRFFWDAALEGMKEAFHPFISKDIDVKYVFFSGMLSEIELLNIISALNIDQIDALALVPVDGARITAKLSEIAKKIPVAFFNEYCDCGSFISVISDGYREGAEIAKMLLSEVEDHASVLLMQTISYRSRIIDARIRGFTETLRAKGSERGISLHVCTVNPADALSGSGDKYHYNTLMPSMFARKIAEQYTAGHRPRAIYIPNGELDPLFGALRKLKQQDLLTYGHEVSPQAIDSFMNGCRGGYVRQDIHMQGYVVMESLAALLSNNEKRYPDTVLTRFDSCQFK
ncbi:MAG: hypothetical protein E7618_01985 [Ruminococcaceae bacterium]|nr:hypothetical protein [Oscillospiraceae bacterium]